MNYNDIRHSLEGLPRLAVIAFAARCARRVQPLTYVLEAKDCSAIDEAIEVAEQVANRQAIYPTARPHDRDALQAAAAIATANLAVQAAAYAATKAADDAIRAAAAAAGAAGAAADAATNATSAAAYVATNVGDTDAGAVDPLAAVWAANALTNAAIRRDLERLRSLHLPPNAAVDPSEFGPLGLLWPEGEPEWYQNPPTAEGGPNIPTPELEPQAADSELVVEIEIPDGVSDEELIRAVGELAGLADDLHRSLGGHGLKIEGLEILEGCPAPQGVPHE